MSQHGPEAGPERAPEGLTLARDEQAFLMEEIAAFMAELRSPEARSAFGELLRAVEQGSVPAEHLPLLERLLTVGLETGRLRRVHKAPGEMVALRLFQRTPRGEALASEAAEANRALAALRGQVIEDIQVTPRGPGVYVLRLGTDRSELTVVLDRNGIRLQSLELNL